MFTALCNQIKQFRKPFPDPGSWAYRFAAWQYDRQVGKAVSDDIDIDHPQEEAEGYDDSFDDIPENDVDIGSVDLGECVSASDQPLSPPNGDSGGKPVHNPNGDESSESDKPGGDGSSLGSGDGGTPDSSSGRSSVQSRP